MSFTVTTDNGKHLFPEHPEHHDKYCWCKQTTPPLLESDAELDEILLTLENHVAADVTRRIVAQQSATSPKKRHAEAKAKLQALLKREVLKALIQEYKKNRRWFEKMAEYADVKADAMAEYDDRIASLEAELTALNQPTEGRKEGK